MIDIHSHLIPGVDDGSQSLEESLSLLKQAEQDGITELITTPHFMKNGEFRMKAPELVQRFSELKQAYKGPIKLHLGNELYIHPDLPELLEKGERKPEVYSSGSFALHSPFTVASMTESSLSSNLLSCASKRLRTELFSTSLFGNMYSSTDTSNIVMSWINSSMLGYCPSFSIDWMCLGA